MIEDLQSVPLSGTWDAALLLPVAEINQHLLEALRGAAIICGPQRLPRLVTLLRDDWRDLDARALKRLAACPYLLLDAGFAQPERWEQLPLTAVMDASAQSGYFRGTDGVALVRRTLILAWHLARSNRLGARVLFGMNALAAERIADSRLQDLEALAERGPAWIAPRWEQQPQVWRQLMHAARQEHVTQLRQTQLRGLQLMAAACNARASQA